MQITGTKTKYYVLSLLGVLAVAVGVLAMAPQLQAQQPSFNTQPSQNTQSSQALQPSASDSCVPFADGQVCLDKTAPTKTTVNQQLTYTISLQNTSTTTVFDYTLEDTLPPNVTFVSATNPTGTAVCSRTSPGVLTCGPAALPPTTASGPAIVLITVVPLQCGAVTNTVADNLGNVANATATVQGCPQGQPQGVPAPVTQDSGQESDSGELNQSFDVS